MLLPSALGCDVRRSSRFTPNRLFSTPPPTDRGYSSGNGLLGTCRALQSLLSGSPAPSPRRSVKPQRLQSPLPTNPPRRSTRSRKVARPASPRQTPPPASIPSTPPPPPSAPARGTNKRRRSSFDDDSDADMGPTRNRFSTPKRQRHAPYNMPLGLSSTDFYSLHSPPITQSPPSPPSVKRKLGFPTLVRASIQMPSSPLSKSPTCLQSLQRNGLLKKTNASSSWSLRSSASPNKNGTSARAKWAAQTPPTSANDSTLS
ncbi:hypothetical protein N7448_000596 [Penicillium atrosanguineum]|nr:hypothetical protein N7448_000596 [Penicillium atrosanguineum]